MKKTNAVSRFNGKWSLGKCAIKSVMGFALMTQGLPVQAGVIMVPINAEYQLEMMVKKEELIGDLQKIEPLLNLMPKVQQKKALGPNQMLITVEPMGTLIKYQPVYAIDYKVQTQSGLMGQVVVNACWEPIKESMKDLLAAPVKRNEESAKSTDPFIFVNAQNKGCMKATFDPPQSNGLSKVKLQYQGNIKLGNFDVPFIAEGVAPKKAYKLYTEIMDGYLENIKKKYDQTSPTAPTGGQANAKEGYGMVSPLKESNKESNKDLTKESTKDGKDSKENNETNRVPY